MNALRTRLATCLLAAFLAQISGAQVSALWQRQIGGHWTDSGRCVALGENGAAYIGGSTSYVDSAG